MIDWHALPPGQHRAPCPACDRGPRDKALSITVDHDCAIAFCHRCGYIERPDMRRMPVRPVSRPVATRKHASLSQWGRDLWERCGGLAGTVGEQYLIARGCKVPPADGDLRYCPALQHPTGYVGPALVALVTHAATRERLTLHRTWVHSNGCKASCEPPRLFLVGHGKAGGVIRLWPDEAVTFGLLVAEGVETALAAAHDYFPAWAAIDAGNLAGLPVLQGLETLIVAADHDTAGLDAATRCADRWAGAGVDVRVIAPTVARTDWADTRAAA